MKFNISKSSPQGFRADVIAIGCYERSLEEGETIRRPALIKHADGGIALDKALDGTLSKQILAEKFLGERGTHRMLFTAGKIPAKFVLLIGLGPRDKFDQEVIREAGADMMKCAKNVKATSVALVLEKGPLGEDTAPSRARAIAEGIILGQYKFTKYKTSEDKNNVTCDSVTFLYGGDPTPVRKSVDEGQTVAEVTNVCRDLCNTPALDATPTILAKFAKKIAVKRKMKCQVLGADGMRKEKMNGVLAVSKGSVEPPAFVIMKYKPKGKPRGKIALVGKGITFDSGGISLKQPRGMEQMKDDMAGAAIVMCAMDAIAEFAPQVEVTGYIPLSENLPDGKAIKPGDIIKARNGKTIEMTSTDCEGRVILADALSFASDRGADAIIDIATLTGGAKYCCGELYSLVMGNNQKLVDRLKRAAENAGEFIWQLPIVEAYKKGYTSGIADLNNTGRSPAQTINGAIFLREFVDEKIPWAHIDIGATSWTDEELPLCPKGASAPMVRTLVNFVVNFKKGTSD